MAGTTIPGSPPEGTEFDTGLPANPQGAAPFTRTDSDNFTASTLESNQEIGFPDNYLICDRSGFRIPVNQGLKQTWDGLKARSQSWERRHPADFVRSKAESNQKGSSRPEQDDVFLSTNEVSVSDL